MLSMMEEPTTFDVTVHMLVFNGHCSSLLWCNVVWGGGGGGGGGGQANLR